MSDNTFDTRLLLVTNNVLEATLEASRITLSMIEKLNALYFSVVRDSMRGAMQRVEEANPLL